VYGYYNFLGGAAARGGKPMNLRVLMAIKSELRRNGWRWTHNNLLIKFLALKVDFSSLNFGP